MGQVWSVRAYKKGDEKGIFELMKAVYPEKIYDREKWMRWWGWMCMNCPAGVSRIWVAVHGNKIIGHYPLILVNMKMGKEIEVASQNIDLMTHPDYRHQGVFSTLEKKALIEANKEGINIIYGFPNESAYPGHLKSGWFDVCPMRITFKPLNLENILKKGISNKFLLRCCTIMGNLFLSIFYKTKKPPEVDGLVIYKITSFDSRINDFWKKVSNDHKILTVRDKEYLNWRYFSVPDVEYIIYLAEKNEKIYGYIVLRSEKISEARGLILGCIFDVFALPDQYDVIHCLISRAIEYFEREKVDAIACKMIIDKRFRKIFRKNGFISSHFIKYGHFCVYSTHPKISEACLKDRKKWFIQLGDSDFI